MDNDNEFMIELKELLQIYEAALAEGKSIYMDADQLADIANWYINENEASKAQQAIDYGLHLHPANTKLLLEQILLYIDNRELQKAKEVIDLVGEPELTEIKLFKAEILLNEGKLSEADELMNTIEFDSKIDEDVVGCIIRLYLEMGFPQYCIGWIKKTIEKYGESIFLLESLAYCYSFTDQNADKAIELYNALIDKDPYSAKYWTELAKCQFLKEDYPQSLEAVDFALTIDDHYGEAFCVKANTLIQLNEIEEATRLYEKAIEYKGIAPYFAYVFLGLTYVNNQNWEDGIIYLEKALSTLQSDEDPEILYSGIYSNLALCYCKVGDLEKAETMTLKSIKIEPGSTHTHTIVGLLALANDETEKANEAFQKALEIDNSLETLIQIGDYACEYQYYEFARELYDSAHKLDPAYPGLTQRLATICVILLDAEGFCMYNDMLDKPLSMDVLLSSLMENNQESMQVYEDFILKIKNHLSN